MYFAKALVLLTAALSASAISTHHMARNVYHRRHALAARDAAEAPSTPVIAPTVVPKKRVVKRCKAKNPTSSSLLSSSATPASTVVATTSVEAQHTSAPNNAGGDPPTFSSSEAAPSTSAAPTTKASPTTKATPTTSAEPTSSPVKTTAASSAAASPTSSSGGDSGVSGTHTGDGVVYFLTMLPDFSLFFIATFYATGLGACGITNTDSDFIAAASHELFDTFP